DQLLHVAHRNRWMDDEAVLDEAHHRDGREILEDVERQLEEVRVHREVADRTRPERVPVRRRLRDLLHSDVTRGAGPILDDDLLTPDLRETGAEQTRKLIGRAAGA